MNALSLRVTLQDDNLNATELNFNPKKRKYKIKVEIEEVLDYIEKEESITIGERTTICLLTLSNGMEVVGIAQCQVKEEFDSEIGNSTAKEDAIDKAYQLVIASELGKRNIILN